MAEIVWATAAATLKLKALHDVTVAVQSSKMRVICTADNGHSVTVYVVIVFDNGSATVTAAFCGKDGCTIASEASREALPVLQLWQGVLGDAKGTTL